MKTIYKLSIFLLSFNIIAQTPVIDIEDLDFDTSMVNAYYKDINNFYDTFEGTWVYTNGNTSFKIVLTKVDMQYTGRFYLDEMIGEYQYIENGVEQINTLNNTDQYSYGIWGGRLIKSTYLPPCDDCPENGRRLKITLSDRVRNLSGTFTLKPILVGGQEALEGFLWGNGVAGGIDVNNPPPFTEMTVPTGTFIFIKQ